MHMQKIRDGPGRSRELWPNVRYADTLGIPKIHLVGPIPILCTLFAFWSIKSQINDNFVDIEVTKLIFGRPQIFIKSYFRLYP